MKRRNRYWYIIRVNFFYFFMENANVVYRQERKFNPGFRWDNGKSMKNI